MLIIQEVLVSEDIIEEHFMCNLQACKGACCWEGDYGAPLEEEEIAILQREYPRIKAFLTREGRDVIREEGVYTYYKKEREPGTPLLPNGACAFFTHEGGIAKCGIEKAYEAGATTFRKPVSCHLYPIRIQQATKTGYDIMNYDRWDICSAACTLGKKEQIPIYRFVREALIRKYGPDFYEELKAAAEALQEEE